MFRNLIPGTAAALLLSSAAVFAADTDMVGTVKSVDPAARQLMLTNGQDFTVAKEIAIDGFKPGDVVSVSWVKTGSAMQAVAISPTGGVAIRGEVKSADQATKSLILTNGDKFALATGVSVEGFNPGDKVLVTWDNLGSGMKALSVSKGIHTPHVLSKALSWHENLLETGTMKIDKAAGAAGPAARAQSASQEAAEKAAGAAEEAKKAAAQAADAADRATAAAAAAKDAAVK